MSEAREAPGVARPTVPDPIDLGAAVQRLVALCRALLPTVDPQARGRDEVLPVVQGLTTARRLDEIDAHIERLATVAQRHRSVLAAELDQSHDWRRRYGALLDLTTSCIEFLGRMFVDTPELERSCVEIRGELPSSDAARLQVLRQRLEDELTRVDSAVPVQQQKSVIKGVLRRLAEQLSSATAGSEAFVEATAQIRRRVEAADDLEELRELQSLLVRETLHASTRATEMTTRLGALRAEVDDSRAQIERLERALSESREAMNVDPLTQVPNRRAMDDWVRNTLYDAAERLTRPYVLLVLDLDHFKRINDVHGHLCGDRVLVEAARRLKLGIREVDFLARYGGEEFVLILPDVDLGVGEAVARRLCAILARRPITFDDRSVAVTTSVGVAQARPGEAFREVFVRADQCVYLAKERGRNQAVTERAIG